MPVKKRTYNTRRIKRNYSYNIQEIAELLNMHKTSVRNWIKTGLLLIDKSKPHLIHGSDLIAFLNQRQAKRKRTCKPYEFYCLKCRGTRPSWKGIIDIKITSPKLVQLMGICATCRTKIFKAGSVKKLPQYIKTFDVRKVSDQHIKDNIEGGGGRLITRAFSRKTVWDSRLMLNRNNKHIRN